MPVEFLAVKDLEVLEVGAYVPGAELVIQAVGENGHDTLVEVVLDN